MDNSQALGLAIAVLAMALSFAMIPATIASRKGHNLALWLCYGLFMWPAAFFHALLVEPRATGRGPYVRCTWCAEPIRIAATVCRHCGHLVDQRKEPPVAGRKDQ